MKRPWAIALIFVAGLAIGGGVVWAVSNDDSGSSGTNLSAKNSASASSSGTSNDLIGRLAQGAKTTFHVRYATGPESGSHAVLEVWHTADKVRRDVTIVGTSETTHTSEFLQNGQFVRCVLLETHPWQCVAAPAAQANLLDPLGGAGNKVKGKDATLSTDTIAGHDASCYTIAPASSSAKPSEFCLSSEDVPLRIDGGDGKPVTATNYDLNVDSSVFAYPAAVAGLTAPTSAAT